MISLTLFKGYLIAVCNYVIIDYSIFKTTIKDSSLFKQNNFLNNFLIYFYNFDFSKIEGWNCRALTFPIILFLYIFFSLL